MEVYIKQVHAVQIDGSLKDGREMENLQNYALSAVRDLLAATRSTREMLPPENEPENTVQVCTSV